MAPSSDGRQNERSPSHAKLSGLVFAAALLSGGAQAFDNHHVNGAAVDIFSSGGHNDKINGGEPVVSPQFGTGSGAGKIDRNAQWGEGGGKGKVMNPDLTVRKAGGKPIMPVSGF
jgi:hypothetical protein